VELEALSTTDGEGGKGQNECLGRGVHEMEEESEVDRASCLVLRARCPVSSLCLMSAVLADGCDRSGVPDWAWAYTVALSEPWSLHGP